MIPHPSNESQCLCLVCRTVLTQLKAHTVKRHFEVKHKTLVSLSTSSKSNKYDRLFAAYNAERATLMQPVAASKKQLLATYKLGWIICEKSILFQPLKISCNLLN